MAKPRIVDLEREIELKDRRIEELRTEVDEMRDLVRRMEEHLEDRDAYLENFITVFGLTLNENNEYTNGEFIENYRELSDLLCETIDKNSALVRLYNANVADPSPVGRPIAASEAQQAQVLEHRRDGKSLRWIAEAMTLSRRTVTTIVEKDEGTDRTTARRRTKLGLELVKKPERRKWSLTNLPKHANALFEEKRNLIKEAKGLKQKETA
jgi:uncharacterized coiled-coil protein SlyX